MIAAPPVLLLPHPPGFGGRLGYVLRSLIALIVHAFLRDPRRVALIVPLCSRLNRAVLRLEKLLARLADGSLPAARPRAPQAARGGSHRSPLAGPQGWLVQALGYHGAGTASQLQAVLAAPEAAPLLATPAALRILNPIRHALGIAPPAARRPRRPAPKPPHTEPPPLASWPASDPPRRDGPWPPPPSQAWRRKPPD